MSGISLKSKKNLRPSPKQKAKNSRAVLKKLLVRLRPQMGLVILSLVLAIVSAAFTYSRGSITTPGLQSTQS